MDLLKKISDQYNSRHRIKILYAYHEMIQLLEENGILVEPIDEYVLLFVFNAGGVTDLSDKEAILRGVELYDAFDPLNRYDTAGELFIELDIIEPDEC